MAFSANDTLDTLLVKATSPLAASPDPEVVIEICNRIKNECEGAQVATKFIAYRIRSPQEKEALNALLVLQECVKSCGTYFHSEIGKFRFLNEMIKLVSPKYDAHRTPPTIKEKVLEMLYIWTKDLRDQPKILEAYDMLKKQGVVKEDPPVPINSKFPPPPPRPRKPAFEDSEKEAELQRLLRSKNPEDIKAANKLIKNMVKEDERRQEIATRRQLELATVNSNVKLLNELLDNVEANGATPEELELCRELATNCQRLQINISRLASETSDSEDVLTDILKASEDLSKVLERTNVLSDSEKIKMVEHRGPNLLLDLPSPPNGAQMAREPSPTNVIDDQLLCLDGPSLTESVGVIPSLLQPQRLDTLNTTSAATLQAKTSEQPQPVNKSRPRGLEELDLLGETLLKQNLPASAKHAPVFHKPAEKVPLNALVKKPDSFQPPKNDMPGIQMFAAGPNPPAPVLNSLDLDSLALGLGSTKLVTPAESVKPVKNDISLLDTDTFPAVSAEPSFAPPSVNDDVPILQSSPVVNNPLSSPILPPASQLPVLGDIFVKFEDVKPGVKPPVSLLSQPDGLDVVLHSARAGVPENVSVFVISTTSRFASALTGYTFQAIVPKTCRVKLQPPSITTLPAFNPFLPPPAITQTMLIACPPMVKDINLKFVISCEVNSETISEFGEASLSF